MIRKDSEESKKGRKIGKCVEENMVLNQLFTPDRKTSLENWQ